MPFRRAAVALSVTLALAATTAPATADPAQPERRKLETVTITTVGWGHGKGLSQYGARARAEAGQRWREIVRHYYPGTRWGNSGGRIRIQISGDTSRDVVVVARPGLKLHALGNDRTWRLRERVHGKEVRAWKLQPAGHRSKVSFKTGRWHRWRTVKGDAEFTAGGQPIELKTPGGRTAYRGALRSTSVNDSGSKRDTVNVLPIDAYLRGVVPREVFPSWPTHALRSQAVAARTYAAFERRDNRHDPYDLCDTDACQVYGGVADETPQTDRAIKATRHKVVTREGRPIFAQFSASNGGWSVDGGYPYLRAEADPFDTGVLGEDPETTTFAAADITRNWPGMGDLVSIAVTSRDGRGPYGGRALELTVTGTGGTQTVSGDDFRDWMGLRSTLLEIT
ncbi:SpoIID/LytB domain-containing protein [Nocardioides sp. YIM 152315]|uniref:SpoIID/LytB domain-containing protein n=1 Tax=Nocardioides sp. YIM 152315 TaxID=3031760 RepID=UPI0023DCCDFD|nr:SpoIID/LytB domain-containing protein [Nocardioides sp. YIM 152315]MDF1602958.1 SpoIID/LytB domain-containing protein [Nocardioides sp. YIM 152315]